MAALGAWRISTLTEERVFSDLFSLTDEQMANIKQDKPQWGDDIPDSKEAYWYRCMFDEHFPPQCAGTVERWTPTWSKQTDPSGRAIASHDAAYKAGEGK